MLRFLTTQSELDRPSRGPPICGNIFVSFWISAIASSRDRSQHRHDASRLPFHVKNKYQTSPTPPCLSHQITSLKITLSLLKEPPPEEPHFRCEEEGSATTFLQLDASEADPLTTQLLHFPHHAHLHQATRARNVPNRTAPVSKLKQLQYST